MSTTGHFSPGQANQAEIISSFHPPGWGVRGKLVTLYFRIIWLSASFVHPNRLDKQSGVSLASLLQTEPEPPDLLLRAKPEPYHLPIVRHPSYLPMMAAYTSTAAMCTALHFGHVSRTHLRRTLRSALPDRARPSPDTNTYPQPPQTHSPAYHS